MLRPVGRDALRIGPEQPGEVGEDRGQAPLAGSSQAGAGTACVPRGERRIAMADGDGSQCALDPPRLRGGRVEPGQGAPQAPRLATELQGYEAQAQGQRAARMFHAMQRAQLGDAMLLAGLPGMRVETGATTQQGEGLAAQMVEQRRRMPFQVLRQQAVDQQADAERQHPGAGLVGEVAEIEAGEIAGGDQGVEGDQVGDSLQRPPGHCGGLDTERPEEGEAQQQQWKTVDQR